VFVGVRKVAIVPVDEVRNRGEFAFRSGPLVRRIALFFA